MRRHAADPAGAVFNVSGQKTYPAWTNHFDPSSIIFTPGQRNKVLLSNAGLLTMGALLWRASVAYGAGTVLRVYGVPWLLVTHWFIMITYLVCAFGRACSGRRR
jgi:hypothetical protein